MLGEHGVLVNWSVVALVWLCSASLMATTLSVSRLTKVNTKGILVETAVVRLLSLVLSAAAVVPLQLISDLSTIRSGALAGFMWLIFLVGFIDLAFQAPKEKYPVSTGRTLCVGMLSIATVACACLLAFA